MDECIVPEGRAAASVRRRQLLRGAAWVAGAAALGTARASAEPQQAVAIPDDTALEQTLPSLTNWGRWGPDDQLDTLNFITAQTRLAAAALIQTGRTAPRPPGIDALAAALTAAPGC